MERRRRDGVEAGVFVPVLGVRVDQYVGAAVAYAKESGDPDPEIARPRSMRTASRGGWALSTAHQYGYSVSPEDGTRLGVAVQTVVSGTERRRTTSVAAELRRYERGIARHHVTAIRLAAGTAFDGRNPDEWFFLGGSGPVADVATLDPRPFGLLRGFPVDRFAGPRMVVANVDYRWPIAWPERGHGTWPLFVRGLQASVFADAGHVWTDRFRPAAAKISMGVELGTSLVLGYSLPLTVSVGAGLGRDGAHAEQFPAQAAYVRVGTAF